MKYSYVIKNKRTGTVREWRSNNQYYYHGDIIKIDGEMYTVLSRNFGG